MMAECNKTTIYNDLSVLIRCALNVVNATQCRQRVGVGQSPSFTDIVYIYFIDRYNNNCCSLTVGRAVVVKTFSPRCAPSQILFSLVRFRLRMARCKYDCDCDPHYHHRCRCHDDDETLKPRPQSYFASANYSPAAFSISLGKKYGGAKQGLTSTGWQLSFSA
ncbi:unnamed protein product [Aphis gossypii]|uniref:Uncharacterized protein n=1 Tax=Aphis gossypii TaxID=80765 RepID=A0A9P0IYC7_APHGO|nr:unnamed protein product [Aphis gossypii]